MRSEVAGCVATLHFAPTELSRRNLMRDETADRPPEEPVWPLWLDLAYQLRMVGRHRCDRLRPPRRRGAALVMASDRAAIASDCE